MTHKLIAAAALFVGTGGTLLAVEPPSALPEDKKADKADKVVASPLDGTYTVVSGEKDGKPVPAERLKGSIVVFAGNTIVGTDKDKKEFFSATYTLDTAKKPWVIRMKSITPKEAEATGLVKKEGDTLTIVYSLPGASAPTEFRTKEKQHLFVLKAMKPEPPKGPIKFQKDPEKPVKP
jgi:uncharacterized protein (TIGR03067 family)